MPMLPVFADVAQGLAACQLGGSLTGGLLLLCFGPTVAAAAAGALHAAAWLAGAALLTRFRYPPLRHRQVQSLRIGRTLQQRLQLRRSLACAPPACHSCFLNLHGLPRLQCTEPRRLRTVCWRMSKKKLVKVSAQHCSYRERLAQPIPCCATGWRPAPPSWSSQQTAWRRRSPPQTATPIRAATRTSFRTPSSSRRPRQMCIPAAAASGSSGQASRRTRVPARGGAGCWARGTTCRRGRSSRRRRQRPRRRCFTPPCWTLVRVNCGKSLWCTGTGSFVHR